jgi:hypothetical protein
MRDKTLTDTVVIEGVSLDVGFEYYPGENEYNGDNGSAPGCAEDYEIIYVKVGGIDITNILHIDTFEAIAEKLSEQR